MASPKNNIGKARKKFVIGEALNVLDSRIDNVVTQMKLVLQNNV